MACWYDRGAQWSSSPMGCLIGHYILIRRPGEAGVQTHVIRCSTHAVAGHQKRSCWNDAPFLYLAHQQNVTPLVELPLPNMSNLSASHSETWNKTVDHLRDQAAMIGRMASTATFRSPGVSFSHKPRDIHWNKCRRGPTSLISLRKLEHCLH